MGILEIDDFKKKLLAFCKAIIKRPFISLALVFLIILAGVAEDEIKRYIRRFPLLFATCSNDLTLSDAERTIREYSPSANSVGLVGAVEKVLCETGALRETRLDGANLSGLHAPGALFYRVSLVDADLAGANLDGATFDRGSLSGANLQNSSAVGATFLSPSMDGTYWDCANFTEATFEDVHWKNVSAQSSIMQGVNFSRYGWEQANFGYSDLRESNFFGFADRASNIFQANVSGMDLRILSTLFRNENDQIFGIYGACYIPEDPPFDSQFPDWTVHDGAMWLGDKLKLSVCGDRTLRRTECKDAD